MVLDENNMERKCCQSLSYVPHKNTKVDEWFVLFIRQYKCILNLCFPNCIRDHVIFWMTGGGVTI